MPDPYELPAYVLSRVRYYDGQFLRDEDFIDEQKYHIDQKRRHDRLLHVAGVAEGLEVALNPTGTLRVSAGTAVDGLGRQLLVGADRILPVNPAWSGDLWLTLRFQEKEDRLSDANSTIQGNTRFTQEPLIEAVTTPGEHAVVLGRVSVTGGSLTRVSGEGRVYSGLRLPGPKGVGYALRGKEAGGAELSTSLSITGSASVGGKLTVTGELEAGGAVTLRGNRLRNINGHAIVQTDASDWLRINPDSQFPAIGLHKTVAIGEGGLSIGDWTQMPVGQLRVTGDVTIGENLRTLTGHLKVHASDLLLGRNDRRGTPGRALVDYTDTLTVNFGHDWPKTSIGGSELIRLDTKVAVATNKLGVGTDSPDQTYKLDVVGKVRVRGDIQQGRNLFLLGTTDGTNAISGEVVGALAFRGDNVQHGQLAFRAGRGFELVDVSVAQPRLAYTEASVASTYADLRLRNLTASGELSIGGAVTLKGNRLRNINGHAIVQTDASDWLRINPESEFPAIGLHKTVAIGSGGLSIGDWTQMPVGHLRVTGDVTMGENLHTLTGFLKAHVADVRIGHKDRRGSPGIALADLTDTLVLNYAAAWPKARVQSQLFVQGDLLMARSRIVLGTTEGPNATAGEVLGVLGFQGNGVQHGQLAFRAGRGFELVDVSSMYPRRDYAEGAHAYADLRVRHLTTSGDVRINGGRLRNINGHAIAQADASDWLRINPESEFPALALYKPVAIGTGGLAVGDWTQMPPGQLRVTGDATILGHLYATRIKTADTPHPRPAWGGGVETWDVIAHGAGYSHTSWKSAAFDLAENFRHHEEGLEPGDVVMADPEAPERLIRSTLPYQATLMGVISEKPGFELGVTWEDSNHGLPLALAGRVPVKVTLEGGPIRIGDSLTSSSEPGHAMRASQSGRIIGMALTPFDGAPGSRGKVVVFINAQWWPGR